MSVLFGKGEPITFFVDELLKSCYIITCLKTYLFRLKNSLKKVLTDKKTDDNITKSSKTTDNYFLIHQ